MSRDLNRMLVDPRKEMHRARGPLAKLYRRILWDLDIKPEQINALILKWLDDPKNAIPNNGKSRSTERGNIIKDLSKPEMTWKNFVKGIRLLRPQRVRFIVSIDWPSSLTSVHEIKLIGEDAEGGDDEGAST